MKYITVLGVTGSIGMQTVDVVKNHRERFKIVAMSAGYNIEKVEEILKIIEVEHVCVVRKEDANYLQTKYPDKKIYYGNDGLVKIATLSEVDIVLNAIVGFAGLLPTIEAIKAKKDIALANKETLVVAGHIITKLVKENGVKLLPVDSEHSAIFQSLNGENSKEIKKIINNENTKAIYLVGSSKNVDLQSDNTSVNDIDLFVFTKNGDKQTRIVKYIENIEFDINYFSEKGVQKFINEKEYFFLKEMKNPKVVYDKLGISKHIIGLCKEKFTEGPNKLSKEDINLLEANLYAKIEDLKNKEKFDAFEYEFLTNLYLKDIIVGYFIINNKWIPKDKKLFKSLKDENIELFRLCKKVIETYEYKDLINVYKYIFI